MEYIASRNKISNIFSFTDDHYNYNLWSRRYWPYTEVMCGDLIYWFDIHDRKIKFLTKISFIKRTTFSGKEKLAKFLEEHFGQIDKNERYFTNYFHKYNSGYCIAYKNKLVQDNIDKVTDINIPLLGWLKLNAFQKNRIFDYSTQDIYENTLDDIYLNDGSKNILRILNEEMAEISPERRNQTINATLRKDSKIVSALKIIANYKCQFPGCESIIRTEKGKNYVEVAHIEPVRKDGQSVLGNLLVLCPNHHKEFDLGIKEILFQDPKKIKGYLNEKYFEIDIINI